MVIKGLTEGTSQDFRDLGLHDVDMFPEGTSEDLGPHDAAMLPEGTFQDFCDLGLHVAILPEGTSQDLGPHDVAMLPEGYILVGDEHLMNVKCRHCHTLKELLIFPGDWRTLKNFQPVLMKVFFCAELKELAKASGYRGSTLSSLETSGSFKRTHNFLLQAWEALYREILRVFCTAASPN